MAAYCREPSEALLRKIVEAASGLVSYFVSPFSFSPYREDLVQAGYEGLLKALKRFEPERKVRFSTFASYYIRGEIRKELRRGASYHFSPCLTEIQRQVYRVKAELAQSLQREPTLGELSAALNISEEGVAQALVADFVPLEDIDLSLHDRFQLPVEDLVLLREALSRLSEIQRQVLYLIFYHDLTQAAVAELLGTNQRRVSRLLQKSLKQLALELAG